MRKESDIIPKWSVQECNMNVLWVCVSRGPDHVVLSVRCLTLISELVTRCRLLEKLIVPQLVRTFPIIIEPEVSLPYSHRAQDLSVSLARSIESSPQRVPLTSDLIIMYCKSSLHNMHGQCGDKATCFDYELVIFRSFS
jgi:hypothetical protein